MNYLRKSKFGWIKKSVLGPVCLLITDKSRRNREHFNWTMSRRILENVSSLPKKLDRLQKFARRSKHYLKLAQWIEIEGMKSTTPHQNYSINKKDSSQHYSPPENWGNFRKQSTTIKDVQGYDCNLKKEWDICLLKCLK